MSLFKKQRQFQKYKSNIYILNRTIKRLQSKKQNQIKQEKIIESILKENRQTHQKLKKDDSHFKSETIKERIAQRSQERRLTRMSSDFSQSSNSTKGMNMPMQTQFQSPHKSNNFNRPTDLKQRSTQKTKSQSKFGSNVASCIKMGGIGFGRLNGSMANYDHVKSKVFQNTQSSRNQKHQSKMTLSKSLAKFKVNDTHKSRMNPSSSYSKLKNTKSFITSQQIQSPVQMIPTAQEYDDPRMFSPTSSSAKSSFAKRQSINKQQKPNNFKSDQFFKEKRSDTKKNVPLNMQVLNQIKQERQVRERSNTARKENQMPLKLTQQSSMQQLETPDKPPLAKSAQLSRAKSARPKDWEIPSQPVRQSKKDSRNKQCPLAKSKLLQSYMKGENKVLEMSEHKKSIQPLMYTQSPISALPIHQKRISSGVKKSSSLARLLGVNEDS